jgi:hypothetical protein
MEIIPSSAPHWHMLLNHFPSVGTVVAMVLLLFSFYLKSKDLNRAGLVTFVVIALLAIPTYVTGGATRRALEGTEGISTELMAAHQDAATLALGALLITGWLSWFALWQYRRFSQTYRWTIPAVVVFGLVTLGLMVGAGSLGGTINHPEILTGAESLATAGGSWTADVSGWIIDSAVVWPTLEALHFMGMAILFGVVLLVAIRVLGLVKNVPFTAMHRLLPLGVFGFMINVVTGMLFFVADYTRYATMTNSFFPKMALIFIGGVAVLYFTMFEKPWELKPGDNAPLTAKVMAIATVLMWSGVIIYGRLLPYLEGEGG